MCGLLLRNQLQVSSKNTIDKDTITAVVTLAQFQTPSRDDTHERTRDNAGNLYLHHCQFKIPTLGQRMDLTNIDTPDIINVGE